MVWLGGCVVGFRTSDRWCCANIWNFWIESNRYFSIRYNSKRAQLLVPVLRQLHWLPVRQHVDFKVATLVHQSLAVWHFTTIPGRRLSSCRRCSWVATAFHSEPNMHSDADIQHLWRQSVRSCWPRTMEQSSLAPERRWHIVLWILAVTKIISVWTVGPRHSVNCINCAD